MDILGCYVRQLGGADVDAALDIDVSLGWLLVGSHIPIEAPEGGLTTRSYVLCEALRSISTDRLAAFPRGRVSPQTMAKVEDTLRILLDL